MQSAKSIAGNKLTSFGWLRVGVMASLLVIAAFAVVALYSLPDPASAQSNQAPVIAALPTDLAIAENATGNVGSPFTATDGDGDTITWSVGGADGDEFSISAGQLSVKSATGLDYEDGATRSLTVTASDGNGGTDSAAVTVTVTDVREPPGRPAAPTVAANSPTISIVTWSAPTNTGPPITRYYIHYCLYSTGCDQNSEWSSYPSTADTTATITGLREGETYQVRVRAKNNEGQSPWSAIGNGATITASAAAAPGKPGAPTVTGKHTRLTVTWSAPSSPGSPISGYNVQYRVLTDPVSGTWSPHTHTGTGTTATITGLTNGTEYEVQVQASNVSGAGPWSDSGAGTPNNIPPVIAGGDNQTISVPENLARGGQTNIGAAFTATDPDGNTYLWNWKLGGVDEDSFWLGKTGGQMQVRQLTQLDYEYKTSYSLTVTAKDANDGTDTINVTVSITDVDEPPGKPHAPTVTLTSGSTTSLDVSWNENPTRIGGPDANDYDVQYRIRDAASWTSHVHTGVATTATISGLTANKIYEVQVRAINPEGTGDWSDSTIRITGTAPHFESASLTIDVYDVTPGGAKFGAPVTATDADGDTLTYTLSGTDDASFTIDSATGQLSLHADTTLDAATYSITVTATDPDSETATAAVTVNVKTCGGFWCATMTAGFSSPNMGYSAPSNGTLLPSSVFEYGGTTYTVTRVARITQTDGGTGTGRFEFKLNPDTDTTDLEELVLEYGHAAQGYSATFALADTFERTAPGDPYEWTFSLIWDQGSAGNSEIGTVHELKLVEKESIDYDVVDDGLIDINSIPQLSAIEFDPDGDGEVGTPDQTKYDTAFPYALAGMGCPAAGCTGYELNNNLSFGATDWNGADAGKWTPLTKAGYTATFEGNGKTLSDLNIFGGAGSVGLFGKLSSSGIIRNVGLEDPVIFNMAKTSPAFIGTLVGRNEGSIIASYARDGEVRSLFWISGGLVGKNASGGSITASYADMDVVDAHSGAGGLVGENYGTITASYAVTERLAGAYSGGLITTIGSINGSGSGTVTNSYWDTTASRETVSGAGVGKTRTELKAPTGYTGIYADWDDLDSNGTADTETLWKFGAANTYPRLKWETNVDTTRGVVLSGQTLTVTEASGTGNTATYTVKLATQPAGGVSVRAASRDTSLVTASPATLTFTTADWDTAQTVTVTGVDNIFTGANARVIITNTASGGGYDDQVSDVMVTLTDNSDPNNAPTITGGVQTLQVAENTTGDIGQFHATDLEGDSISWSLGGTDADLFRINANGWVWVPETFDYENDPTTYSITVTASDATGSSTPLAVTVEVTDAKEPPLAPTNMVADGFADSKIMVKWTAPYDDETGRPPVTSYEIRYWRWSYAFPIEPNITGITGLTYAITGLLWETHYSVQVRARNADGASVWSNEDVGATLEEGKLVNFAPTITGFPTGLTIDENATGDIGTPFVGFDYEGDTLTWSVDTPNNQLPADQLFAISQTGQLSVVAPGLDYEEGATRSVTVRVTSNVSSSAIKTVEVTVNDVDETPSAPTGLTLDSEAIDSLTLSWTEPANTGPPVTGYTVCVNWQSPQEIWFCKVSVTTTYKFESLSENTEYEVRVQAESDEGRGAWSEISKFSTSD